MKRLFTFLLSSFSCFFSFSQNIEREAVAPIGDSHFTIGSKGGFGHSYLYPYANCIFHPSWQIGIATMFMGGDHVGLSIDGLYSAEGARFRSGDLEAGISLSYFRLPVKLNYFFRPEAKDFRPKISVGPSFGFLMKENDYKAYQRFDLGATASAGFSYRILRGFWLHWDAAYYHGLKDMDLSNKEKDQNANLRMEIALMVGF